MQKIIFLILLSFTLNAEIVDGISAVVKGEAITLYDVKKEMQIAKVDSKSAMEILIRKALERSEIKEREISVTSSEVYEEIQKTAQRNNMSVSKFYSLIREKNGLSSSELKEKIKESLLSQKLYASIAYKKLSAPTQEELQEYFRLHKEEFSHPTAFDVLIYRANRYQTLEKKISNPMYYSKDISSDEKSLEYSKISPDLAQLLEKSAPNTFTPVVPDGKGSYMTFYIKSVTLSKNATSQSIQNQITNRLMAEKRQQALSDYFAKLRHNAEIKIIREVE
jgi:parvulin-like peptidyl-prolyl isomerase